MTACEQAQGCVPPIARTRRAVSLQGEAACGLPNMPAPMLEPPTSHRELRCPPSGTPMASSVHALALASASRLV